MHKTPAPTATIFMQETADQRARRRLAQQAEWARLQRSDPPTNTAHPRAGEAITIQPSQRSVSPSQYKVFSDPSSKAAAQAHQAVTDELAALMTTGDTLEEDIPTAKQIQVAAIYVPAALTVPEVLAHSTRSAPPSLAAASAAAEPSIQADTYSDQKDTAPTTPGCRTEAQCSRTSANTLPSPPSASAPPASQINLADSIEPIPKARAPQRDSMSQEDIRTTPPSQADSYFRPHHHFFRSTSHTLFAARQSASVLTFLGARAPFSFSGGQIPMGSAPMVRSSAAERASPVSCIGGKLDSADRLQRAPQPLQLIKYVAARALPPRPSVIIISDTEEPSDAPSAALTLSAEVPTRRTQKQRPNAAQAVSWAEWKAPHKRMGCGPYFPAPPSPTEEPVVRQAVALPKRQEDLVRIKAEDRTDHRSTRSANRNYSDAPEAAKDASSGWCSADSSSREGESPRDLASLSWERSPQVW
jgi:hypothetical protein